MVGISCAACHTEDLSYQGVTYRIEGGPGKFDLIAYYSDLGASIQKTLKDPVEFFKFFARVTHFNFFESQQSSLAPLSLMDINKAPLDSDKVANQLRQNGTEKDIEDEVSALNANPPPSVEPIPFERRPEGDVEQIQQSNSALQKIQQLLKSKENSQFNAQLLQNIEQYQSGYVVQYATKDTAKTCWTLLYHRVGLILELARASGKGVEDPGPGRIDAFDGARDLMYNEFFPQKAPVKYPHLWSFGSLDWIHYDSNTTSVIERNMGQALGLGAIYDPKSGHSTIIVRNLHSLESTALKLTPPAWPAAFGKPDPTSVARGSQIFVTTCAACHNDNSNPSLVPLTDIGTDSARALNFASMDGTERFVDKLAASLALIRQVAYQDENLTPAEIASIERGRHNVWQATSEYAPRSLHGIWANAPYLHNGSVPTLADLLTSQELRPEKFFVGTHEYDPVKVGYETTSTSDSLSVEFDTTLPGNGNLGHSGAKYGTTLSKEDKQALLNYLKTL
jgi:hypothetical protein